MLQNHPILFLNVLSTFRGLNIIHFLPRMERVKQKARMTVHVGEAETSWKTNSSPDETVKRDYNEKR